MFKNKFSFLALFLVLFLSDGSYAISIINYVGYPLNGSFTNLNVSGNSVFTGTTRHVGATRIDSTLNVTGNAYFSGYMTIGATGSLLSPAAGNLYSNAVVFSKTGFGLKALFSDTVSQASITNTIGGSGKPGVGLGAGGTTAQDTNLYRDSANNLKTDDNLTVALGFNAGTSTGATTGQGKFSGNVITSGNFISSNDAYGGLTVSYNATATTILSASAYVTITNNVLSGTLLNMTYTSSDGQVYLTAQKAGTYLVTMALSFSGGNNDEFHGGISKNNAKPLGYMEFSRKMGATADVGSATATGIVVLAVNDTLRAKITNETDADDPTIKNMNFTVRRLGQ